MGDPSQEAVNSGWSAADVDPSEYVDDDWIAANTTPMKQEEDEQ